MIEIVELEKKYTNNFHIIELRMCIEVCKMRDKPYDLVIRSSNSEILTYIAIVST